MRLLTPGNIGIVSGYYRVTQGIHQRRKASRSGDLKGMASPSIQPNVMRQFPLALDFVRPFAHISRAAA